MIVGTPAIDAAILPTKPALAVCVWTMWNDVDIGVSIFHHIAGLRSCHNDVGVIWEDEDVMSVSFLNRANEIFTTWVVDSENRFSPI